ncbi:MAG: molybdate ABC transporter substrate-binding protein [Acidobacteriota bacterium]
MQKKRFRASIHICVLCIAFFTVCLPARENRTILVSAAISLKNAFKEMGVLYEETTGVSVQLNLSSSGLLQKQIEAGAPVDVYASAGMRQMDALQEKDLIFKETREIFARNRLVLVQPSDSTLDLNTFSDLARHEISRIAIGNPKTVPAGQYAEQALRNLKLWDRLRIRLVLAENVRQVLDYVSRGEADAGFVYASDVPMSEGKTLEVASAPADSHSPILYPIAVVKDTKSPTEAERFIHFVLSDSGQAIMEKYGFLSSR